MSIVKAYDVTHARFRVPDLGVMRQFLDDFGMLPAQSEPGRLFMRGLGGAPFVHVAELGEPGFVSFGLSVLTLADLQKIADHDSAPIEALDAPGGGSVVRLTDPDGYVVEVVFGQALSPMALPARAPWNEGRGRSRRSEFRRVDKGPAHVIRLGHIVLGVTNFRVSEAWYKTRFGLLTSDEIQPVPGFAIGAFMRADRGDEPCDHHTVFLFEHPKGPGFMHAAFEVLDMDDLMAGHEHLLETKRHQAWGVGRHILGSQIFDYWKDPWGHEVEHWTDGDQLNANDEAAIQPIDQLLGVQWGMPHPPEGEAPDEFAPADTAIG